MACSSWLTQSSCNFQESTFLEVKNYLKNKRNKKYFKAFNFLSYVFLTNSVVCHLKIYIFLPLPWRLSFSLDAHPPPLLSLSVNSSVDHIYFPSQIKPSLGVSVNAVTAWCKWIVRTTESNKLWCKCVVHHTNNWTLADPYRLILLNLCKLYTCRLFLN